MGGGADGWDTQKTNTSKGASKARDTPTMKYEHLQGAAQIVNSGPLFIGQWAEADHMCLSDLLLGRAKTQGPLMRFKTGKGLVRRLKTRQEAKEELWDRCVKEVHVFLSLLKQVKWFKYKWNVHVILRRNKTAVGPTHKYAHVVKVHHDKDRMVRTADIKTTFWGEKVPTNYPAHPQTDNCDNGGCRHNIR
jgi:hypothetical protein